MLSMSKGLFGAACLVALTMPASAQGFDTTDLTRITVPERFFGGSSFEVSSEPDRLTVMCRDCGERLVVLDVTLGRQTDGTEERYRSGVTTIASLEAQCKSRAPECTLEAIEVGGAVGWVTTFDSGAGSGSTAVLLHDGDMMILRALAPDTPMALKISRAAVAQLAVQIVGQ